MGRRYLKRAVRSSSVLGFATQPPKYGWGRCPGCASTVEPLEGVCFVCGCPATWRQIERAPQRVNAFHPILTRTQGGRGGYDWKA